MEKTFKYIIQARRAFIALVEGMTIEQLNYIPEGFNNNIIWNFGHIIVATQGLCYLRTGVRPDYSIKYGAAYAKGSRPTYTVSPEEVEDLKILAIETIEQIENDYQQGLFSEINPFATSTYNEVMHTIEDVIITSAGHDNLHFGYALAQRRIVHNIK